MSILLYPPDGSILSCGRCSVFSSQINEVHVLPKWASYHSRKSTIDASRRRSSHSPCVERSGRPLVLFRFCLLVAATNSMSLASVHPAELHSRHSSLATFSHSLDDLNSWDPQVQSHHALTIEELRLEMTSCFTCGVSWAHMHVSLDCAECGGYALERPCPVCDGACGAVWKRDLSTSHASSRARWQGTCNRESRQDTTSKQQTQELCSRLEKLSADS